MTFGEKLQRLRAREGLSQDALAELLNVSRQAVSRWERDGTMPETEKVIRISGCFHVTTDYLLKGGPERFPHPPVPCPTQARYGIRMASCWGGCWRPGAVCFSCRPLLFLTPGLLLAFLPPRKRRDEKPK